MNAAKNWKNSKILTKDVDDYFGLSSKFDAIESGRNARNEIIHGAEEYVSAQGIGRSAVETVVQAQSCDDGIGKIGRLLDIAVPEQGDDCQLITKVRIPAVIPGGFFSFSLKGKAVRGTVGAMTMGVPSMEKKDEKHLEVRGDLEFGAGFSAGAAGVSLSGGFFTRAGAKNTSLCMKALSYGFYKVLNNKSNKLGAFWGGGVKGSPEQAALWAGSIEEQVFEGDDVNSYVDLGVTGSAGGSAGGVDMTGSVEGVTRYAGGVDKDDVKNTQQSYHAGGSFAVEFEKSGLTITGQASGELNGDGEWGLDGSVTIAETLAKEKAIVDVTGAILGLISRAKNQAARGDKSQMIPVDEGAAISVSVSSSVSEAIESIGLPTQEEANRKILEKAVEEQGSELSAEARQELQDGVNEEIGSQLAAETKIAVLIRLQGKKLKKFRVELRKSTSLTLDAGFVAGSVSRGRLIAKFGNL